MALTGNPMEYMWRLERFVLFSEEPVRLTDRSFENKRTCTYQSLTASRKGKSCASTGPNT